MYQVIKPVVIKSGILKLSNQQAEKRLHNLEKVESGYEVINDVCFKVGEKINMSAKMAKQYAQHLELMKSESTRKNGG